MTAILVARYTVKNADKMEAYATAAGPSVAAHGGEFIAQGENVASLVGQETSEAIAMVRFADVATAKTWFASPEYSACKDLRAQAADMQFTLYETT
jgi:uncharacterized protein (DUF1330 family)